MIMLLHITEHDATGIKIFYSNTFFIEPDAFFFDLCFLAVVCVVRVEGTPYLCQTDEVGEICVSSGSTGVAYFGLPGMTKNTFEVSVSFV